MLVCDITCFQSNSDTHKLIMPANYNKILSFEVTGLEPAHAVSLLELHQRLKNLSTVQMHCNSKFISDQSMSPLDAMPFHNFRIMSTNIITFAMTYSESCM